MIKFFHHLFNPHCPYCKADKEDDMICDSCEVLKLEIERLRHDNNRLLNSILEKPIIEEKPVERDLKPIYTGHTSWKVRKQALEAEDREKARLMRNAPVPATTSNMSGGQSIEDIERELGVAQEN